jgi:hypothetical protein
MLLHQREKGKMIIQGEIANTSILILRGKFYRPPQKYNIDMLSIK